MARSGRVGNRLRSNRRGATGADHLLASDAAGRNLPSRLTATPFRARVIHRFCGKAARLLHPQSATETTRDVPLSRAAPLRPPRPPAAGRAAAGRRSGRESYRRATATPGRRAASRSPAVVFFEVSRIVTLFHAVEGVGRIERRTFAGSSRSDRPSISRRGSFRHDLIHR